MSFRNRLAVRVSAAAALAALPLLVTSSSPGVLFASDTAADQAASSGRGVGLDRAAHQQEAEPTTIAGGLQLRTAAERRRKIEVTSAKGSHTFTASSLAEHDLPSAAMRAYKNAAHTIDTEVPGCHLPWTLLAGIGRVESNHGRYGGSVLGADGVPRPAIVGVALDGKGAVAAIHDTDGGRFDGDTVWDRAVGPMQFIPSTWRTAGRDGDGDGVKSPNDIDDAALAAAAYLCHGGRDLRTEADTRAAIFSYNPSDYYVDLVSAFARGYASGTFVIPSPPVAPGAGDGVVHLSADATGTHAAAKAKRARARAARLEARRAAEAATSHTSHTHHSTHHTSHHVTPVTTPSPSPSPTPTKPTKPTKPPKPTKPAVLTVTGAVTKVGDDWQIGTQQLTAADVAAVVPQDYDGDGTTEPVVDELDGLVTTAAPITLSYSESPFTVVGLTLG